MSSGRLTLAQQLKELHEAAPVVEADPETAYSSLNGLSINAEASGSGRDHYVDVGRSKIRDTALSTFDDLTAKYTAPSSSKPKRVRIFDDDDDEDDDEENGEEGGGYRGYGMGEMGSGDDDDDEDEDEDDEDDEEEDHEDEEVEGDEQSDEDDPSSRSLPPPRTTKNPPPTTPLNPLTHLAASKQKDVLKGQHIIRQQKLFDELLTVRIGLQKGVVAGRGLMKRKRQDEDEDEDEDEEDEEEEGEVEEKRRECLERLGELSDGLFELREALALPGTSLPTAKRPKPTPSTTLGPSFWLSSISSSLSLSAAFHPATLSILTKWSTKISSATLLASAKSSSSAFTAQQTVLQAIDAGLAAKARADARSADEMEEGFYKSLLREVIESRSGSAGGGGGGGAAGDLERIRKEKKKAREAERGGSKGRRLRYTVHEKAQNFTVPMALEGGWHDEQVDELFGSLLGGAGAEGTAGEAGVGDVLFGLGGGQETGMDVNMEMDGGVVGGLRVF